MMTLLLIVIFFFLGAPSAAEFSAPDSSALRNAQGLQSGKDAQTTRGAPETTATGCLLGQNGRYVLITAKQASALQLVSSPTLEAHVGQEVKLTGTIENNVAAAADNSRGDDSQAGASSSAVASATGELRVRKIKTISPACDAKPEKPSKSWTRILHL
jgi:hypothetical protein